ncbi:hypothetical protein PAPYR_7800 [Paratrimastix pyriformis]|uniref:Uncharacterized protein n=1 Tax=Paratrimastix pyriformis TaxID=342808 RepID=A0ABQ8UHS6_9EUKA|nr:hypothetical protein PAPYR_7800 [Paratrimastix pyriformis]
MPKLSEATPPQKGEDDQLPRSLRLMLKAKEDAKRKKQAKKMARKNPKPVPAPLPGRKIQVCKLFRLF